MFSSSSAHLRKRPTSGGPRISYCYKFQKWMTIFLGAWVVYVLSLIVMAAHVHKIDPTAAASEELLAQRDQLKKHQKPAEVSLHQVAAGKQKAAGSAASPLLRQNAKSENDKHALHPSLKIPVNVTFTKRKEEIPMPPKPQTRRKNWKAEPYGHMVKPEAILGHPVEDTHLKDRPPAISKPRSTVLTAFHEPVDQSQWEFIPLPPRTTTAEDLEKVEYPQLNSCQRLPEQWPVDLYDDKDPFLPWIHDVFPSADGKVLQFVAQNRRRCNTGTTESEEELLKLRAPQVALFQHVPLKKIGMDEGGEPRYRLSSHEEADPESIDTRYICQFHGENIETMHTFSKFNHDYEWVAYRKHQRIMFSPDGRDNKQVQTSQLLFQCPIPHQLQEMVRNGSSVVEDWATIFVDLIPIRTPPRYGSPNRFIVPAYEQSMPEGDKCNPVTQHCWDPEKEWGKVHVLPTVANSGRWQNIPICLPSLMAYEPDSVAIKEPEKKNHHLVSCLWASTGYTTRGNRFAINDGQRRLMEWITFNLMLGFEKFYIYDNSGAFSNETSLHPVAAQFPGKVTILDWPHRVCNNNPNNVDSCGERSSQYAAESSCRLRFGPHVNWIGQFDIDEYLVPMGNNTSILPVLEKLEREDKKIISFASWRAWPRRTHINEPHDIQDKKLCGHSQPCFELSVPTNTTVLEAYNCDRYPPGQKEAAMPAEKQIYKADYVTQHFIHYSTVTQTTILNFTAYREQFGGRRPFPDPKSRFTNEVTEGLMIHSKAIARQDTADWRAVCNVGSKHKGTCRIGFPWPDGIHSEDAEQTHDEDGWQYNCYVNPKVENYWGPKLREKLVERGILTPKTS